MNARPSNRSPRSGLSARLPRIGLVPLLALSLSGCDWLLGPDVPASVIPAPQWSAVEVGSGEVAGLDMALVPGSGPIASYIHNGQGVRVSRLEAGIWSNLDGPTFAGPQDAAKTHIAVSLSGDTSVLYYSAEEVRLFPVAAGAAGSVPISSLTVSIRDNLYEPPARWAIESSGLAYGEDGRLRVLVRDADEPRIWMFREEDSGWSLGVVPSSTNVSGPTQIRVGATGNEHIVFQASGQGYYFWWRSTSGWMERVRFVAGLPYLLRLRPDESSVLTSRRLDTLRIAEEQYNPSTDAYRWQVRDVVYDEDLYWHNNDLVLDEDGLPTLIYILGPLVLELTAFRAPYRTSRGVDLCRAPFNDHHAVLGAPDHYEQTQRLGAAMRGAGVEAFRYPSARDAAGGVNVGLFTPRAFASKRPESPEGWSAVLTRDAVEFVKKDFIERRVLHFPPGQFEVDGRLASPAV